MQQRYIFLCVQCLMYDYFMCVTCKKFLKLWTWTHLGPWPLLSRLPISTDFKKLLTFKIQYSSGYCAQCVVFVLAFEKSPSVEHGDLDLKFIASNDFFVKMRPLFSFSKWNTRELHFSLSLKSLLAGVRMSSNKSCTSAPMSGPAQPRRRAANHRQFSSFPLWILLQAELRECF